MLSNSLLVEGIPEDFELFTFGSSNRRSYWKYRLQSTPDWAVACDISIIAQTRDLLLMEVDNDIHLLGQEPFSAKGAKEAAMQVHAILGGRVNLFGGEEDFSITPIEEDESGSCLRFDARFTDHFVFGTSELRNVFLFHEIDEPAFVHIQIKARAGAGMSAGDSRFENIRVIPALVTDQVDRGARLEPSRLMVRMHEEGTPTNELNLETMDAFEQELKNTLPELHVIGHLTSRINIVMRRAEAQNPPAEIEKALAWCHEASRMALDLPDDHFRHFVAGTLKAKISMLLSADQRLITIGSAEALGHYIQLLCRLPSRSHLEISVACYWFLATFQDSKDLVAISEFVEAIVPILPDDGSLSECVNAAIRTCHVAAPTATEHDRLSQTKLALKGIRRCELAVDLLHRAASAENNSTSLAVHQALFSDIHIFNCGYQAELYGLPLNEINTRLEMTMSGMPPGVLLLRPLSVVKTVYLRNEFDDSWKDGPSWDVKTLPFISLEGALTSAVRPLLKATNAVGGLTDILGMGRSGVAGFINETDAGWKLMVRSLLELSDVIFVLPDMSDGLRWELDELRSAGRISDCIFIHLPKVSEWSDGGNRRALKELLGISPKHLSDEGCFLFGDPSLAETDAMPWSSLWDGALTKAIAQR